MRPPVDEARLRELARRLGRVATAPTRIYLTGGATAVLEGWRDRSPLVFREGNVEVHHFDFYSQALSKIERGFGQDLDDVARMLSSGLVEPERLRELYDTIEPQLYRYPAIDPTAFRRKVTAALS
jgi:hypothetical protein